MLEGINGEVLHHSALNIDSAISYWLLLLLEDTLIFLFDCLFYGCRKRKNDCFRETEVAAVPPPDGMKQPRTCSKDVGVCHCRHKPVEQLFLFRSSDGRETFVLHVEVDPCTFVLFSTKVMKENHFYINVCVCVCVADLFLFWGWQFNLKSDDALILIV